MGIYVFLILCLKAGKVLDSRMVLEVEFFGVCVCYDVVGIFFICVFIVIIYWRKVEVILVCCIF